MAISFHINSGYIRECETLPGVEDTGEEDDERDEALEVDVDAAIQVACVDTSAVQQLGDAGVAVHAWGEQSQHTIKVGISDFHQIPNPT